MIVTLVKNTNGTREVLYGRQPVVKSWNVESYTYSDISEEEVKSIRDATSEQIQEILSKLY